MHFNNTITYIMHCHFIIYILLFIEKQIETHGFNPQHPWTHRKNANPKSSIPSKVTYLQVSEEYTKNKKLGEIAFCEQLTKIQFSFYSFHYHYHWYTTSLNFIALTTALNWWSTMYVRQARKRGFIYCPQSVKRYQKSRGCSFLKAFLFV